MVDLTGVTFVDAKGKALLFECGKGVRSFVRPVV